MHAETAANPARKAPLVDRMGEPGNGRNMPHNIRCCPGKYLV